MSKKFKRQSGLEKNGVRNSLKIEKLINNCNYVLAFLDGLEEQRSLNHPEITFRILVKISWGISCQLREFIGNNATQLDGRSLGMKTLNFVRPWLPILTG